MAVIHDVPPESAETEPHEGRKPLRFPTAFAVPSAVPLSRGDCRS